VQAGKPDSGKIGLTASHAGAQVIIQVQDDGGGLDHEAIRAKGVKMGWLAPEMEISDQELFNFIMSPGFSTAREITSVSGRGVGMDVVKKAIEALQGSTSSGATLLGDGTVALILDALQLIQGQGGELINGQRRYGLHLFF
jgi:two-component system chemotaxis sensor kinase CheA